MMGGGILSSKCVLSKFQVPEVFDVPPVLVNRWQADPHAVQRTEVHSGD